MSIKLKQLLALPTLERTTQLYEEVYDDFIRYAGGTRLTDKFNVPNGKDNADYIFYLNDYEIILELKQVTKYEKDNSIDEYFQKELNKGKLQNFKKLNGNKIQITPESLSKSEWDKFYKKFRPSISRTLNKASSQLKDTETFIHETNKSRFKGVILINSNDYNLATDLLFRLVEWKIKKEWKMDNYSSIDFVSCTTIDMFKNNQNPLYARHIAKTIDNPLLINAVRYLYEKWISYVADALNMKVTKKEEQALLEQGQIDLVKPFQGKILFN
ncbi:MAG: hypothetical protein WC667_01440 [Sulfurimonas sp.]|jgi:hypothetical protein